ncbi:hypothetical protein DB30_00817 [Enhygromyxa salina]|uniref:Uncharacterized protein n=1 Tax=Enhygromyxa salina TaxID=215803 RepID=A0A0C1ZPL8_9BACT|nr:hypothetical protein DB30_00817 [Enhygromyxa salina]
MPYTTVPAGLGDMKTILTAWSLAYDFPMPWLKKTSLSLAP